MKKEILILVLAISAIVIVGCQTTGEVLKSSSGYECYDNDNGFNTDTAGKVYGSTTRHGNFDNPDYCLDERRLVENFCSGNQARFEIYHCSGTCVNGAC